MLYQLSYSRYRMVEGEGFEPSKANAGRFTVCSLWPLGYPSTRDASRNSRLNVWAVKERTSKLAEGIEPATC